MKNSHQELNKYSYQDKLNKKGFIVNYKQHLSKKYSKNESEQIKQEKLKLTKSTTKNSIKNKKEIINRQIKSYKTKNDDNNKNMQKNKNNNNTINSPNNTQYIGMKRKEKKISSPKLEYKDKTQSPFSSHISNINCKKKFCSRNHLMNNENPQLTDFVKNKNGKNNANKSNKNNDILKSNLGFSMSNHQNNKKYTLSKDDENYLQNSKNLSGSNDNIMNCDKNEINRNNNSSENYLIKDNNNFKSSSLINAIININRYLTNDVNSKSTNRLNRDRKGIDTSKKIYENQLITTHVSKNISIDKEITNISKSDFLQDNYLNKNNILNIKSINNEYNSPIKKSFHKNKIMKKRNSFDLGNSIISNKSVEEILGYKTPRISINNNAFYKTYRIACGIDEINHSLFNINSDYNSKKNRKVSKKISSKKNSEYSSFKKENYTFKKEYNDVSTKTNTNKDITNYSIIEKKNLKKINEFTIESDFDIINEESKEMKDYNCNNIFDEKFNEVDTQLNEYNFILNEKEDSSNNNNIKSNKHYSCSSCIYSPVNIHNQYNTLYSQRIYNYYKDNMDKELEENDEHYYKTLVGEENNSKIQEIKIKLNNMKKINKPKKYLYYHSPSYRLSEHKKYQINNKEANNYLNFQNSQDKMKKNNQNVYVKQIFGDYHFNSKSKDKKIINKCKINVDNINQLVNMDNDYLNKKCIYNSPKNININNNVFQQNNFYTTNNYFTCASKRFDSDKICSPRIYKKPTKKRNSQTNIYLNFSPKTKNLSPKINMIYSSREERTRLTDENDDKKFNIVLTYNKNRTKTRFKENKQMNNINKENSNNKYLKNIRTKVINNNIRCKKYYDYFVQIKPSFTKICFITKKMIKNKNIPKCKRSFITKTIHLFIQKPKSSFCFISKIYKNKTNSNNLPINRIFDNKDQNIIKANILDFSLGQNKEKINENNNRNQNRIIKYMGNEKNYQESFGEINLSFSTEEINSFRQKESTIEAVFTDLINMNSLSLNTENEAKITFCPNLRNNNYMNCNSYEATTYGRMINNSSNYAETDRTEKFERTSYKRDDIFKEMKENININSPIKYEEIDCYENEFLNTERVHLNRSNNKKSKKMINSKDVINFTETLGNIFNKEKNCLNPKNNIEEINPECMTNFSNKTKKYKDLEIKNKIDKMKLNKLIVKMKNIKKDYIDINKKIEQNEESFYNITFNTNKNNNINYKIKEDIIVLLNIITINNFNEVSKKIMKIVKEEKQNLNIFFEIFKNKFNNEKKFSILYTFLGKYLINELNENKKDESSFSNILNICIKYDDSTKLNGYEKYTLNIYKSLLSDKNNSIVHHNYDLYYLDSMNIELLSMMKNDLFNYNATNKIILFEKYNTISIYEIIQSYIEICIDNTYENKLSVSNCNDFINKIIENHILNNCVQQNKKEIYDFILNIDNIVVENKNMYEIMGYLVYCLLSFRLYSITDLNSFLSKDECTITNLAKILKYAFSFFKLNNIGDFHFIELKKTKLFNNYSHLFKKFDYYN